MGYCEEVNVERTIFRDRSREKSATDHASPPECYLWTAQSIASGRKPLVSAKQTFE